MVGHAFSVIFTPFANYAADRYGKVIENIVFTQILDAVIGITSETGYEINHFERPDSKLSSQISRIMIEFRK